MPPINVTVDWPDGQTTPTVSQDPILVPQVNGATVITWSRGVNVATFAITGLDGSQFTPVASNGQGRSFTTNDANSNSTPTEYSYTLSAVHADGRTSRHDPKIQNDA
jgi:hypothetical protein